MYNANIIEEIQFKLELRLPKNYREFLSSEGSTVVDGFSIVGIPTEDVTQSVVEATQVLRVKRPDISIPLVPITFVLPRAVCLDLSRAIKEDAPLVELSLKNRDDPREVGYTFSEWLEYHRKLEKRSRAAWKRIENRRNEARGKTIQHWSTPIFKVRDYVVALGACRFNFGWGCVEVDEFFPVPQPHVAPEDPVKVLLSELFARGRDYCGCLQLIFTKDEREDEYGELSSQESRSRRKPAPIPQEVIQLAQSCNVHLSRADEGVITHQEGVDLWFNTLDLPPKVRERIEELEKGGYATKEVLTEVVYTNTWSREEMAWAFLNASRPEALLLGSDAFVDRSAYVESLNFGRAALIGTRLRDAVMAEMNQGFSREETEEAKTRCYLEAGENGLWFLRADGEFHLPSGWHRYTQEPKWFSPEKPVLLLCKPFVPHQQQYELARLAGYLQQLLQIQEDVQGKYLVLSNEYISPYYCPYWQEMEKFVRKVQEKGVEVIFAPIRMDIYLDNEVKDRMQQVKKLAKFPSRYEPKKLQIIEIPEQRWEVPEDSRENRAIQNASESASIFAHQLLQKREVKRYGYEFSLMCEVIEREAMQNHRVVTEVEGETARELEEALQKEGGLKGAVFSFVRPEEMELLLNKLSNKELINSLKEASGGIAVVVKHWEQEYIPPQEKAVGSFQERFPFSPEWERFFTQSIENKKKDKVYASKWGELDRAHKLMKRSLQEGIPFGVASLGGRIRANVFVEMIREYIYSLPGTKQIEMPISYGDGSQGGPFSLFSLPRKERPDSDERKFFRYHMGTVSCRHMEADDHVDRYLIRNRDIQNRETNADQEEVAYRKTYGAIEEMLQFLRGELRTEEELSLGMKILLDLGSPIAKKSWSGLNLHLFHTTGLESAEIGAYRAVLDLLGKYQGELIVTPRILIPSGYYKKGEPWY